MARLTLTARARADLREIRAYIAKDNPRRRAVSLSGCAPRRGSWRKLPGMGRSRAEDLRPDLFSFPVGKHVLL